MAHSTPSSTSPKATLPRRYMFSPVSMRAIPRIRREILCMRSREAGVEREITKTRTEHTQRAQLVRAAAAERTYSDMKRLQKLERELESLAARKNALFDSLKQSLTTTPVANVPSVPEVPASYSQIRRNLRAGKKGKKENMDISIDGDGNMVKPALVASAPADKNSKNE